MSVSNSETLDAAEMECSDGEVVHDTDDDEEVVQPAGFSIKNRRFSRQAMIGTFFSQKKQHFKSTRRLCIFGYNI
jgi:hypothetical protein